MNATCKRLAGLLLVALSACAEPASRDDAKIVADRLELEEVALVQFGAGDSSAFHRVIAGAIVGNTVLLAEASTGIFREYTLEGTLVRSFGGTGRGPGEFVSLGWAQLGRTERLGFDLMLRRLTAFDSTGRTVRQVPLPAQSSYLLLNPFYVRADGSILVRAYSAATLNQLGTFRPRGAILRISPDGQRSDSLASFDDSELNRAALSNGGIVQSPSPFGLSTSVVAADSHVYVIDNSGPHIRRISMFGAAAEDTIRPRVAFAQDSVTDADVRRERALYVAGDMPGGVLAARFDAFSMPKIFPHYGHRVSVFTTPAAVTSSGQLWLGRYQRESGTAIEWIVISPNGNTNILIRSKRDLQLLDATEDRALVLLRDADGAETVELRRIVRSP